MFKAIKKVKIYTGITYLIDLILIFVFILLNKDDFNNQKFYIEIFICISLPLINSFISNVLIEKSARKHYIKIANTIGGDVSEAYKFGGIGILIYDDSKIVVWSSELFDERNINVLGEKIDNKFPGLKDLFIEKEEETINETTIYYNKRSYIVNLVKELNLIIFKDVTDQNLLSKKYQNEKSIIGYILIDDSETLRDVLGDDKYFDIQRNINSNINEWCNKYGILSAKLKDNLYLLICNEDMYLQAKNESFDILEKVLKLASEEAGISLSIGFGRGECELKKLNELAKEALNIAESRGGNQVVTSNYETNVEFYCLQGYERIKQATLSKLRIVSKSFATHIMNAQKIFLVPHKEADFDAIGACLGIYQYAKRFDKEVYIVSEEKQIELKARLMFTDNFDSEILIKENDAINELEDDSLCIVCDVSRVDLLVAPKLIESSKNVIVIDHHRESDNNIDNTILTIRDIDASSTCEIVSLLLSEINGNYSISNRISTYLLTGILLDTNNLSVKTNPSTFKACMFLQENNADIKIAKSYLKDELEEFELKSKILATLETPLYGFALSIAPSSLICERATLAKVCNEMIDIKGVKAAFVIGYIDNKFVGISARSDGSINVQLIMEKLGGGGHHSSSAAQLEDCTLEEARSKLIGVIKLYNLDI